MEAFEKSKEGKRYRLQSQNFVKRKRITGLKARFLKDEPQRPKNATKLFFAAKHAEVAAENPDLKGFAVNGKLSKMWASLSDEERQEWKDKEAEANEEYNNKVAEFQKSDNYKKYQKLSRALLGGGGKGKAKQAGPAMPEKPPSLPSAPPNSYFLFSQEKRASGGPRNARELNKVWLELGAEGQKVYNDRAAEMKKKYDSDMIQFSKSGEGKKYLRLKQQALKRQKLIFAKKKFLGETKEPKRPLSSYFMFLGDPTNSKEAAGMSMGEKSKHLTAKWNGLTPEEKSVYEIKAKAAKEKYDEQLKAYQSTKGFQMYQRTLNSVSGNRAKMIARAKANKAAKDRADAAAARSRLAAGRGRGAAAAGRGGGVKRVATPAASPAKANADSNSDQMGSDSSSSSSKKSSSSSKSSASD